MLKQSLDRSASLYLSLVQYALEWSRLAQSRSETSKSNGRIIKQQAKKVCSVMIGPDSVGQWISTQVKSIQRKRVPVSHADAGQSVSFALKRIKRNQMRKGMLLVGVNQPTPKSVRRFEATVLVLYHSQLNAFAQTTADCRHCRHDDSEQVGSQDSRST